MSNPFAHSVLECALARTLMASVWCINDTGNDDTAVAFRLQEWTAGTRVLELSTNIRSGKDRWWNEVLEQCRQGALSEDNYNWLHGFPAKYVHKQRSVAVLVRAACVQKRSRLQRQVRCLQGRAQAQKSPCEKE